MPSERERIAESLYYSWSKEFLEAGRRRLAGDTARAANHLRYRESIAKLTPADVYFGRAQIIPLERERINRQTIQNRRLNYRNIDA